MGSTFQPWNVSASFHCLCGHPPHPFPAWFPDRGPGGFTNPGSLWAERGNNQACAHLLCSLSILRCRVVSCAFPTSKAVYLRGHTALPRGLPSTGAVLQGGRKMSSDPSAGVAFLRSRHLLVDSFLELFLMGSTWLEESWCSDIPSTPQEILLLAGLFTSALKLALELGLIP